MTAVETATAALREAIELVRSPRLLEEGANVDTLFSMSVHKRTEAFEVLLQDNGWERGSDAAFLLDHFVETIVPPMLDEIGDRRLVEVLEGGALFAAVSNFAGVTELPEEYATVALAGLIAPFTELRSYRM